MPIESLIKLIEPKVLQQIQESFASKNGLGIVITNEQGAPLTTVSNYFSLSSRFDVDDKRLLDVLLSAPIDVKELGLEDGRPVFASFMDGLITRAFCPMLLQGGIIGIVAFIRLEKKNDYNQFEHWAQVLKQNPINSTTSLALLDPQPRTPSPEVFVIIEELKTAFEMLLEAGIDLENTLHTPSTSSQSPAVPAILSGEEKDGQIYTSRAGDIQKADKIAVALLGFDSANEIFGLNFLHHFVLEAEDRRIIGAKLIQAGKLEPYRLTLERKDGHTFFADLSIIPHQDADQTVLGFNYFIKTNSDFSELLTGENKVLLDDVTAQGNGHSEEGGWDPTIEEILSFFGDDYAANKAERDFQVDSDLLDELANSNSIAKMATPPDIQFSSVFPEEGTGEVEDSVLGISDAASFYDHEMERSDSDVLSAPILGATLLTDLDGVIEQANYAALKLLAVKEQKIVGQPVLSLFEAKDQEILRKSIGRIAGGTSTQVTANSVSTLHESRALSVSLRRLTAKQDAAFQLLWFLQPESEDKPIDSPAYLESLTSDEMIAGVFDCHWAILIDSAKDFSAGKIANSPLGGLFVSAKVNPPLERLVITKSQHTEKSWGRFVNACLTVLETGQTKRDIWTIHNSGETPTSRRLRHVLFPLNSGAKIVGVQGLCIELTNSEAENPSETEPVLADQASATDNAPLLGEEEVLLLLNNLGSAFLTIGTDGRMVLHNDVCYSMLGYDKVENAIGDVPFTRLVGEKDRETVWTALQQIIKGREKSQHVAFTAIKADKSRKKLQATLWPQIKGGQITGVQAVLNEVESKEGSLNAIRHLHKLDGLGLITGGIAHDFGNLITEIFGYTSLLLLEENLHSKHREIIMHIQKVAQWSSQLTRQLLYFSKSEKPTLMPVQLNRIVNQSIELVRHFFPHNVSIDLQLDNDLDLMMGDATQLQQVVNNLCMNARDAMPNGGLLSLRTMNRSLDDKALVEMNPAEGKSYVLLQVIDTGSGIPPEVQDRIFEPFFSTKPTGNGIGLGLASAYGIVKNHKGFIKLDSKVNQGSTFTLFFPAVQRVQYHESSQYSDVKGGDETLLIIDDEQDIIEVNSTMLERYGYKVFTATSGQEGIEILKKHVEKIDLAIIDVMLPDMTGPACAEKIYNVAPHCSVILSSGYHRNAEFNKTISRIGGTWLQKPYDSYTLLETVRDVLDKKQAGKR